MDEMLSIRDNAANYLEQTNYIPAKMFDTTKKILEKYRMQHNNQVLNKIAVDPTQKK
jgi:hypothetical protein